MKHIKKISILFALSIPLFFYSCTEKKIDEKDNSVTFTGRIITSSLHSPVEGASVRITNGEQTKASTYTSSNGAFELEVKINEVDQSYYLLVSESRYSHSKKWDLKGWGTSYVDFGELELYDGNNPNNLSSFSYSGATYYVHPSFETSTWRESLQKCMDLNDKDYSDWILPTMDELQAMKDSGLLEENKIYWSSSLTQSAVDDEYTEETLVLGINTASGITEKIPLEYSSPEISAIPIRRNNREARTYHSTVVNAKDLSNIKIEGFTISEDTKLIEKRGVCWSFSDNPSISDNVIEIPDEIGDYSVRFGELPSGKKIFLRSFVKISGNNTYSETFHIQIPELLPVIKKFDIFQTHVFSAQYEYEISSSGKSKIIERGVCWSKEPHPTIDGWHLVDGTNLGNQYGGWIYELEPETKYYAVAYAINDYGVVYSDEEYFTTKEGICKVDIKDPTDITSNSLKCSASVDYVSGQGDIEVVSRGICYKLLSIPYLTDDHIECGTGVGTFTTYLTDLVPGEKYDIRAYAVTNTGKVCYSPEKIISTKAGLPSVSTGQPTAYSTKILITGKVNYEGATAVTKRGACYSTNNSTPTISDFTIENGTGSGSFDIQITGLTKHTKYYIRAFATNENGTCYGECRTVTTTNGLPTVTTDKNCTSGVDYLEVSGSSSTESEYPIIRQGICWSTISNPSINDNYVTSTSNTSTFSCRITGLEQGTTYYCRAFAENVNGIDYGTSYAFTTQYKPTTLCGYVYDQDGKPIASAKISGTAPSTTTDSKGYYSVSLDITESKYYSFFCSCEGYNSQDKNTYITRGQNNQLDFNLSLENNFAVDFGDGNFLKPGEFWLMYFQCAQTNLPGTKTSKNMRIKNYKSIPVSWNLSSLPTKGIKFSPQKGTIASKGEVTINVTFTYPSPSTTGATMLQSSNGSKLYVWAWQGYYVDCYINTSTNEGITNPGSACCAQDVYLQVDNYSEAFELCFNQFVSYR